MGAASLDAALRRRALGASPSARSLLFTILGEYVLPRGGAVWSKTLIDALAVFGVEEKSARQAMARTEDDGWLRRERVGRSVRWRLTDAADVMLREGAERIYGFGGEETEWDGRFVVLVASLPDVPRDERRRLSAGLAWAGFGTLRPGVWIAAHPEREAEAARVLDGYDAVSFVGTLGELGVETEVVKGAWDLDDLEDRYEAFIAAFAPVRPRNPQATFEALTRLVHEWRKFPFLDPGLPARLLPAGWSGSTAHDLFLKRRAMWKAPADEWFDGAG